MNHVVITIALASGCVLYDDSTRVTLRDPSRVAVEVATPSGRDVVLPLGAPRADIPATAPPYVSDPVSGSWLERSATIDAWCPNCRSSRRHTLVDGPVLLLAGTVNDLVRVDGEAVRVRYTFVDGHPCKHRPRYLCDGPKLALDLVTPVDNVSSIRFEHRVSPRNGGGERGDIIFGVVWAVAGIALAGLGSAEHSALLEVSGGAMIATGGGSIADGVVGIRARDELTVIALPR